MKLKPPRYTPPPLQGHIHPLRGLIWAGIKGNNLSVEEKRNIQGISGLILFKRNIESLAQLFELCREIHSLDPPPLIMMDREGGTVDRLKHLDFPSWPGPAQLAKVCTLEEIEKTAFYMAREMKALGICINFAPCVDVPSVENPLFKERLWGDVPEEVFQKARAYFHGLRKAGLAGCAKHFPGHGGVTEDSHLKLPVDHRDFKWLAKDLFPFRKMIEAGVEMIMSAHVLYSGVDASKPATLSSLFLEKILREELKFQGLIVSDDLDMKALYNEDLSLPEVMAQALFAGVDILLKCEPYTDWEKLIEEVELILCRKKIRENQLELKKIKVEKFRQKYAAIKPVSSFEEFKKIVAATDSQEWCQQLRKRISGSKQ